MSSLRDEPAITNGQNTTTITTTRVVDFERGVMLLTTNCKGGFTFT